MWIAVAVASLVASSAGVATAGDVGGPVGSSEVGLEDAPSLRLHEPPVGERIGGAAGASRPGSPRYIVRAEDRSDLDEVVKRLVEIGARPTRRWHDSMFAVLVELDQAAVRAIQREPAVASVEMDRQVFRIDSQSSPPWGLSRIDQRTGPLDDTYNFAQTGLGVTAYVIDTGLWLSHQEFTGRVVDGAYVDFGDGTKEWDCNGHGTHVTGTLGGSTYGVAKGVSIVPVKVLDCSGSGTTSTVIAGIDWVIEHHVAGEPAVANLSLGGIASSSIDAAVEALIADGVTVVVAAGNDAAPTCNYSPARVPSAVTVAASTNTDQRAWYSNYGSCNDLFAPGSRTLSAYVGSDTATAVLSGTSMASPHVAGAAALLLETDPSATPAAIAAELDARSTKGVLTIDASDPNKLLYVGTVVSPEVVLTVAKAGSGTGTVVSSSVGIDCDSVCTASVPVSTIIDLTVDHAAGSTFTGWSGGGCSGTSSCAVTMDTSRTVTATFTLESHQLTVSTAGSGSGTVSSPTLSSCSTTCSTPQPHGSSVTLTATPTPGSTFTGWSGGGCSGTSSCAVTMDTSKTVTATFTQSFAPLAPKRLLDSRITGSTVDGRLANIGPRAAGTITELTVTGRGGVPADADAVILNVTATQADTRGFVTVFPCNTTRPNASNLNYTPHQTVANAVIAKTSPNGTVCVYTEGTVHLIVDVNGAL